MSSNFYCEGNATMFGIFDMSFLPQLLAYSFVPTVVISLFLSIFILIKDKHNKRSILLFLTSLSFTLWSLNEALQWVTVPVNLNLFFWQMAALFEFLVSFFLVYFILIFLNEKLDAIVKIFLFLPLVLVVMLLSTSLNIEGFNLWNCEGAPGQLIDGVHLYGTTSVLALAFIFIKLFFQKKLATSARDSKKLGLILVLASFLFLLIFLTANIIGETTKAYVLGLIAPIGMVMFLCLIAYTIVKYHAFNIKLAAAQALVVGLVFLIGSLFFFAEGTTDYVLITITFILASIGGYYLVKSVKKEIKQREEIELLAMRLEVANERLKELDKMKSEFVSIASHQLRGPITSIRGYASMLVEGSYGKLPERAKEVLEKLVESSKFMALSIEDYLNVSRIEAGNMKYELSDFNLREIAEKVVDEMRPVAMKKGLVLVYRSDTNGSNMVHADIGKTRQVIMNLIDNSIKYTPKGTITVVAHDDMKSKLMCITIQDTGIGMSKETIEGMFDKFVRAKNANSVNVTGTGLGLFVAKKMITQMNGRVWAESEGEGKGSTFHIELPLLSGKAGR
jgi:signal transduction histidine kinase